MSRPTWTAEHVIESIQLWQRIEGRPPSFADWSPAAVRRDTGNQKRIDRWERGTWPSASTVIARFGSWSEAIRAAGFEPRRAGWQMEHEPWPKDDEPESRSPGPEDECA